MVLEEALEVGSFQKLYSYTAVLNAFTVKLNDHDQVLSPSNRSADNGHESAKLASAHSQIYEQMVDYSCCIGKLFTEETTVIVVETQLNAKNSPTM